MNFRILKPYTIRLQGGQMLRSIYLRKAIQKYAPKNSTILDAGCDTGRDAIYLSAKYPDFSVFGIDINSNAISEAKTRLAKANLDNANFEIVNILDMPYKDKFDVIYSIEVLEHIYDYEKCINNFQKALKPNGKLIIHVPCPDQKRHFKRFKKKVYSDHIHDSISISKLASALKANQLRILEVKYTSGWFGSLGWEIFEIIRPRTLLKRVLFPVILLLFYIDALFPKAKGNNAMIIAQRYNARSF